MSLDPTEIQKGDQLFYIPDVSKPILRKPAIVQNVLCSVDGGYKFEIDVIDENGDKTWKLTDVGSLAGAEYDTQEVEAVFAAVEDAESNKRREAGAYSLDGELADTPVAVAETVLSDNENDSHPPSNIDLNQQRGHEESTTTSATLGSDENTTFHSAASTSSATQPPNPPRQNNESQNNLIPPPKGQAKLPIAALYTWCNRSFRLSLCAKNYVTWDDGGMDHIKSFTSIFVDPRTGECFCSGRFEDDDDHDPTRQKPYKVQVIDPDVVPVVWYRTKKMAEHGAAARAYDCLTYREGLKTGRFYVPLGLEKPSEERQQMPSYSIPDHVYDKIVELSSAASGDQF